MEKNRYINSNPVISFLVTYYNQKKYVKDSLESIYKINIPFPYEILVGDDGSTDGTPEEVLNWKKNDIDFSIILAKRDTSKRYDKIERVSRLRFELLKRARGKYFCILDGDDCYCDTEFIREAVEVLDYSQGISVVAFGYNSIDNECRVTKPCPINLKSNSTSEYVAGVYTHAGACVLRRITDKAFYKRIDACVYYDDNDIVIANLAYGDIIFSDKNVYGYRQLDESICHSISKEDWIMINLLGYDVECYYAKKYEKELTKRYFGTIISAIVNRRRIAKSGKYRRLVERVYKETGGSLCYDLVYGGRIKTVLNNWPVIRMCMLDPLLVLKFIYGKVRGWFAK